MKTRSSGANFIDRTGERFGRWTVSRRADQLKKVRWVCVCDCGTEREVSASDLVSGRTNSCGCIGRERAGTGARAVHRATYMSWIGMRQRVYYVEHAEFHRYGGRGITIDPAWSDFEVFLADMGPRPAGRSIERRDNDGPYSAANCYWATKAEQSANTSRNVFVEHEGETFTLKQLAERLGCNYYTLHGAYRKRGLPIAEAIRRATCPNRRSRLQSTRRDI